MKVMFFSAHPDDEIAGAGGTLIKTTKNGGAVKLVLCIDPAEPRFDHSGKTEREVRLKEFKIVAKKLKAEWSFLNFPHYPQLSYQTVLPCVKEIRAFQPDIVIILQELDYHSEHALIAKIVKRAVWHSGRSAFPQYGVPHKVNELWEAEGDRPIFEPNHFENITEEIDQKKSIFHAYGSQVQRKPLVDAFLGINRYRGVMYKKGDYAEAFKTSDFFYG
ncbi:PIG-L family deacetylase [Candidatus Amesbacteria bacterium]|nr:PIG-L family deacetylase [Candidatus Amesbacteria bacterium]